MHEKNFPNKQENNNMKKLWGCAEEGMALSIEYQLFSFENCQVLKSDIECLHRFMVLFTKSLL